MALDPLMAEIMPWTPNFAPRGWAFCDGQLLTISQHSALFSLIGTIYGGDGRVSFALPDLRSRVPIGSGQGPGLSNYGLGAIGGHEQVTLTEAQIATHSHDGGTLGATMKVSSADATSSSPIKDGSLGSVVDSAGGNANLIYTSAAPDTALAPAILSGSVGQTGGGQAHENRMPYQAINFCIALEGVFPSRQ